MDANIMNSRLTNQFGPKKDPEFAQETINRIKKYIKDRRNGRIRNQSRESMQANKEAEENS